MGELSIGGWATNFRRCSICESEFCRRYAIASLPLSGVGAVDYRLAGIAVIALE